MAGIWERWERGDDPVEFCAIITTDANDLMQPLYDRIPVILRSHDYDAWIDPSSDANTLQGLLQPYPDIPNRREPRAPKTSGEQFGLAGAAAHA